MESVSTCLDFTFPQKKSEVFLHEKESIINGLISINQVMIGNDLKQKQKKEFAHQAY